jgi:hypothetical protein
MLLCLDKEHAQQMSATELQFYHLRLMIPTHALLGFLILFSFSGVMDLASYRELSLNNVTVKSA